MHIARQLRYKRAEIDLLARDRQLVRFELAKVAHLGDQRADALARSLGFLQHLPLLVGERPAVFLQHHPEVSAHDRDRRAEFVHGQRHRPRETVEFVGQLDGFDMRSRPACDAGAPPGWEAITWVAGLTSAVPQKDPEKSGYSGV